MDDYDLMVAAANVPTISGIAHLRRAIAEIAQTAGDVPAILQELGLTPWDTWITEAKERKASDALMVVCNGCNHNMPYAPNTRYQFCTTCLQTGYKKWQNYRYTPKPCSVCGGAHSPSALIEVTIPYGKPGHNGKQIKYVCPVAPELELDPLKFTCTACDSRYFPFHSEHLCNTCWDGSVHKEWARVHAHNTRAKVLNLPGTLTIKQWLFTLDHFNYKCAYCQKKPHAALEHYVPLPYGSTSADNCLPSCQRCNLRKGPKHPNEFANLFPPDNLARIHLWLESQRDAC